MMAGLALTGCALTWEKADFCDTGGCDECQTDQDCVTGYSCCSETLYCLHRDEELIVCQLGCYEPQAPACTCVDGRCRF